MLLLVVLLASSHAAADPALTAAPKAAPGLRVRDDGGGSVCLLQGAAFLEKALSGRSEPIAPSGLAAVDAVEGAIFDLWAQDDECCDNSDEILERKSGMVFSGARPTFDRETDGDGVKYWDLTSRSLEAKSSGTSIPEGEAYTHAFVLQWSSAVPAGTTFLSLVSAQDPNSADTESCGGVSISGTGSSTRTLGTFSRRSLAANGETLRGSGFELETRPDTWELVAYTGQATSGYVGKTTFYTQDEEGTMSEVGESDRVCTGWRVARLGTHIGKLSRILMWDRILSAEEMAALPSVLSGQTSARIAKEQLGTGGQPASSTTVQSTVEQGSSSAAEGQFTPEQGVSPSTDGQSRAEQGASAFTATGQAPGSEPSTTEHSTAELGSEPGTQAGCTAAHSAEDLTDARMEALCGDPASYDQSRGPTAVACSGDGAETEAIKTALANQMFHWCGAGMLYDTFEPRARAWQWHTNLDDPPRCWSALSSGEIPASGELATALEKSAALCAS
jgi:hypothetical protein